LITSSDLIEFETKIKDLFEDGDLPFLLHLCGGNEEQLIEIFKEVKEGDWIFSTHRSHYHYLLAGGKDLEEKIRKGKSMFVFGERFITSSILAGTCGIAAGVALELKDNHVWCFLGDGAEEEGHFYEAVLFVDGMDLPCTFIIEDNDRQVDTPKAERGASRLEFPKCVRRYHYTPTYPHAGAGGKWVQFNPEIVSRFSNQLSP